MGSLYHTIKSKVYGLDLSIVLCGVYLSTYLTCMNLWLGFVCCIVRSVSFNVPNMYEWYQQDEMRSSRDEETHSINKLH